MFEKLSEVARALGVAETRVSREVAGAIRRSEPDAREVYGVVNGKRIVARREGPQTAWVLSIEHRPQPWEPEYHSRAGQAPRRH